MPYRVEMSPNDGRHCMSCRYFLPDDRDGRMVGPGCMSGANCKLVTGAISPMGYCNLYTEDG